MWSLGDELAQIREQGAYRQRRIIESPQGATLRVDGRTLLNFAGNDYLGLANHPEVRTAFQQAVNDYGVGSGAAHLICGHSRVHHELEEALAELTGRARAVLFSTGFMANQGVISALLGRGDSVLQDRLNHASLLDGAVLARADLRRYRHADLADLSTQLLGAKGKKLIVSDGVFSMDGDLADVAGLAELAGQHQAALMIDDAHGFGVLGAQGGGVVEHLALSERQVPILMATLGKAMGTFGAFVAGSEDLIEYLIQKARSYIYTTAMPSAVAAATLASLRVSRRESWRRQHLAALISRFRSGAEQLGLNVLPSFTAIQPIMIGDNQRVLQVQQSLSAQGVWVGAIRPPTVPKGTARLRITLSAAHTEPHIDQLLGTLAQCLA